MNWLNFIKQKLICWMNSLCEVQSRLWPWFLSVLQMFSCSVPSLQTTLDKQWRRTRCCWQTEAWTRRPAESARLFAAAATVCQRRDFQTFAVAAASVTQRHDTNKYGQTNTPPEQWRKVSQQDWNGVFLECEVLAPSESPPWVLFMGEILHLTNSAVAVLHSTGWENVLAKTSVKGSISLDWTLFQPQIYGRRATVERSVVVQWHHPVLLALIRSQFETVHTPVSGVKMVKMVKLVKLNYYYYSRLPYMFSF